MLQLFLKKKLTEEKVANVFINTLLQLVENNFGEIAQLINDDPEFEIAPAVSEYDLDKFLMIAFAGNMKLLSGKFEHYQELRIKTNIYRNFANALNISAKDLQDIVEQYDSYFSRINHPSKNTHLAMAKAVFYKYDLNPFQQEYFRHMNSPNPIFLKRVQDILAPFLYNWEELQDNYRIIQS